VGKLTQAPIEDICFQVSGKRNGEESIGLTGNPVQGSFDWFDILSPTSVFDSFELLDKLRTGWTSAVGDIHDG